MPNLEVRNEWKNCSFGATDSGLINCYFQRKFMNAIRAEPFNILSVQSLMRKELKSCSFFDTKSEKYYHMIYFGIFKAVCGPEAISNNEAPRGRYDIGIVVEDMKRLFIFKFKHSKVEDDLEKDAKDGLQQIRGEKNYEGEKYSQWTCFAVGVSFFQNAMSSLEFEQFQVS